MNQGGGPSKGGGGSGGGGQTPSGAGFPSGQWGGAEWLRGEGRSADVVMSSRVRLARNLAGFPFMTKAKRGDRQQILDLCRHQVLGAGLAKPMMWVDLHESPQMERTLLVERHLISQQHARGKQASGAGGADEPRAVGVSLPGERLSIMVNEEDHLRIQVIRSGLALDEALAEIDQVDDKIEGGLDYAFSPRFGYLTACPTNVGTGVRMSVMLHLPGLKLTGDIEKVKRAASDMNLAVRGFYGEGSEAAGDFYQVSNQTTLGKTEQVVLHELQEEIIPRVIEYEQAARRTLLTKRRPNLEDQVFRALGVLSSARLMTTEEAMQLLSHLRLGVLLSMVSKVNQATVNELMLLIQPAHLQRVLGKDMDQEQRRIARANLLRTRLTA
jgi:protein arginine kinase